MITQRQQGQEPEHMDKLLTLLQQVCAATQLSEEQRQTAAQWIQDIERPRRQRKTVERFVDKFTVEQEEEIPEINYVANGITVVNIMGCEYGENGDVLRVCVANTTLHWLDQPFH